jgi:hypothetical protein
MSGGSHNYLCLQDNLGEFENRREELELMVKDISELVEPSAALSDTLRVAILLDEAQDNLSKLTNQLRGVWRAVEWYHSGDSGREQALRAIREYEVQNAGRR